MGRTQTVCALARRLTATDEDTLEKIKYFSQEGRWNERIENTAAPSPLRRRTGAELLLGALYFSKLQKESNRLFQTEIRGEENAKRIWGCVVCCNHVNLLDGMAVRMALGNRRIFTATSDTPPSDSILTRALLEKNTLFYLDDFAQMKAFSSAATSLLRRGNSILFYPEKTVWWGYEKPRPLYALPYRYAAKCRVPVLPIFITFEPTEASQKSRVGLKKFIVNILPPIYPDYRLPLRERAEKLRKQNAKAWQACYDCFYRANRLTKPTNP